MFLEKTVCTGHPFNSDHSTFLQQHRSCSLLGSQLHTKGKIVLFPAQFCWAVNRTNHSNFSINPAVLRALSAAAVWWILQARGAWGCCKPSTKTKEPICPEFGSRAELELQLPIKGHTAAKGHCGRYPTRINKTKTFVPWKLPRIPFLWGLTACVHSVCAAVHCATPGELANTRWMWSNLHPLWYVPKLQEISELIASPGR